MAEQPGPNRRPTLYVSGPMTGLPDHNLPTFADAARALAAAGYEAVDPGRHGVPADAAEIKQPTTDGRPDPRDDATLNAIAHALTDRFGWLPLDARDGAARKALDAARAAYALHGDIEPAAGDSEVSRG